MEITVKKLKAKNVCREHMELFKKHFGESVVLTRAVLAAAPAQGFELDWFARNLLSKKQQEEYNRITERARLRYERVELAAWLKILDMKTPAWDEYQRIGDLASKRVKAQAPEEYESIRSPTYAEYQRTRTQAREERERVKAAVLADILQLD